MVIKTPAKNLMSYKNINQKYYCSNHYISVNKYGFKCGTSLRFWENKKMD